MHMNEHHSRCHTPCYKWALIYRQPSKPKAKKEIFARPPFNFVLHRIDLGKRNNFLWKRFTLSVLCSYFEIIQHSSFTYIFVSVRKLDFDSLTETKNLGGRNEIIVASGRPHL